ncbi:nuclear transport factor 2 family protein [Marinoscillum sp.]|uniref:nuclear transport factor 2 family protein n=1 Tax=Marinoscillum sp. TaxID=2024838 RepID=UPI003BAB063B
MKVLQTKQFTKTKSNMKTLMLMSAITLFVTSACHQQSADEKAINKTIHTFSKAGDEYDAGLLELTLDTNFRIVMNRLFGSPDVSIMPREVYLEKIRTKEYGGDSRQVQVESVNINETTACARVRFIGREMTFVSILNLVKDPRGVWKLVSEMPVPK